MIKALLHVCVLCVNVLSVREKWKESDFLKERYRNVYETDVGSKALWRGGSI